MIDYAGPMMSIETTLKEMHNALLERDMETAMQKATILLVEAKLLQNTLVIMQEKEEQHALRQQAPTLQERVPATEGAG